jgi:heat shock protein HtpX
VPATSSLIVRAILAIALMVGFYVLALALCAGLLWIPYAEWAYFHRAHGKILFACVGTAGAILYAIVPRRDHFAPPGPELLEADQPRLFQLVREVAMATGQLLPAEVYLLSDVNAWVTHRGGVMGFGSRRVMGIGLPLLQSLTVSELRAVLAHEFGHYSGGDVAIGPWIYKTRAAIGRSIEQLGENKLRLVFDTYGRLFMKLTMAISRQQEFTADQVAARVAGREPMKQALRQVTVVGPAHASYISSEVIPVLQSGFLPPVASGFNRFLADAKVAQATAALVDEAMTSGQTGEFDSHPALRERLAALDLGTDASTLVEAAPATTLVTDADALASAIIAFFSPPEAVARLKPVQWDDVAAAIYLPQWVATAESHRDWLTPLTPDALPSGPADFVTLGRALVKKTEIEVSNEDRVQRTVYVLAASIGALLSRRGWTPRSELGQPLVLVRGEEVFEPFSTMSALADRTLAQQDWQSMCARMGIAGESLGPPART